MTHQGCGPAVCPQIDVEFLMLQQPRDHLGHIWDLLQPASFVLFCFFLGGEGEILKQTSSTKTHRIQQECLLEINQIPPPKKKHKQASPSSGTSVAGFGKKGKRAPQGL